MAEPNTEKKSSRLDSQVGKKKFAALNRIHRFHYWVQFCIAIGNGIARRNEKREIKQKTSSKPLRIAWKLARQHIHKGRLYHSNLWHLAVFFCLLLCVFGVLLCTFSSILRFCKLQTTAHQISAVSSRSVSSVRIAQKCNHSAATATAAAAPGIQQPMIFRLYQKVAYA